MIKTPEKVSACIESYARLKNLKLVAAEIRVSWSTVYLWLREAGVAVSGDKARYGSDKDRLAASAEAEFQRLVPFAENQNDGKFQSKVDFKVHSLSVDVKAAHLVQGMKRSPNSWRWAFSVKKQELSADFIACFAYTDSAYRLLLIPGELVRNYQTIALSQNVASKWWDYEVQPNDLSSFFNSLKASKAA